MKKTLLVIYRLPMMFIVGALWLPMFYSLNIWAILINKPNMCPTTITIKTSKALMLCHLDNPEVF